jgi:hypothetical protein
MPMETNPRVVFERKPGVEVSAEYHCVLKYEEY